MAQTKRTRGAPPAPEGFPLFLLYAQFFLEILGLFLYIFYRCLVFIYRCFVPAPPKSLRNEIVLVTGGANGIGREVCHKLLSVETQITIIIWDVNEQAIEETLKELKNVGAKKVFGFKVDVSNREEVEKAAEKIRQEIGHVSILFNNAGIAGKPGKAWEIDPKVVEKVYEINAISHCYTLREFLPAMIQKGKGHVVETCSVLGFFYGRTGSPYIGSKHAVKGYVESVKEDIRHLESKPDIKFSLVYPHNTLTNMTADVNFQAGKYHFMMVHMTPKFVADKIVEGMLRDQEHIYVPGDMRMMAMLISILPPEAIRRLMDIIDIKTDFID